MKKLVDDQRLIFRCCQLYYEEGQTQQEICDRLEISRPTVSRMLDNGRRLGFVQIKLNYPDSYGFHAMEREMEARYGLKEVIIVPTVAGEGRGDFSNLGREVIGYLERVLNHGDVVGVSMGSTLYDVVNSGYRPERTVDCSFVSLVGGVSERRVEVHANSLSVQYANLFGARPVQLFAPAILSGREVIDALMKEQTYKRFFEYYDRLTALFFSVGIPRYGATSMEGLGYVESSQLKGYIERGAVGNISMQLFDAEGNTGPYADFNERVVGLPLSHYSEVPLRIGVAYTAAKATALRGAALGGIVNVVIADEACASALLAGDAPT